MRCLTSLCLLIVLSTFASATDWLTYPSTYTHHPITGERVVQYEPVAAPTAPAVENFETSGFTHTRSSLNYGASSDNYHRVEKWGDEVRPYGEWRFPYRPYSTPYPNWGPPYAGFNLGLGFPGAGFGGGRPGHRGDHDHGQTNPRPRQPRERGFLGDGNWPVERKRFDGNLPPASPFNPYPAGPGTPYPVAPYYDGFYGG